MFFEKWLGDRCNREITTLLSIASRVIVQLKPACGPLIKQIIYCSVEILDLLTVLILDDLKSLFIFLGIPLILPLILEIQSILRVCKLRPINVLVVRLHRYSQLARFVMLT